MTENVNNTPNCGATKKTKRAMITLAICLVLILIATMLGSMIQTAGWSYTVEDLRNKSNSGTIMLAPTDDDPNAEAKSYAVKGNVVSGVLFRPKNAKEGSRPAIVFTHGLYNNREMQLQNAIEMVRRGYVVMVIDHGDHGHNTASSGSTYMGFYNSETFIGAAKYLYNLPEVNKSKIGVSGHSMGGAATAQALSADGRHAGTQTDANLAAGKNMGIISAGLVQANNAPSKVGPNVIAAGIVKASSDEFFFSSTLKEEAYVPVNKDRVTEDNYTNYYVKKGDSFVKVTANDKFKESTQYYNFTKSANTVFYLQSSQAAKFTGRDTATLSDWTTVNGGIYANGQLVTQPNGNKLVSVAKNGAAIASATNSIRAVYEAKETHPMNHFSSATAAHVIDFFYNAFGNVDGYKYKAPTNQTWLLKEIFSILGFLGLFGMIIAIIDLALSSQLFASLKGEAEEAPVLLTSPRKHVSYWLGGILTAWFSAYSLKHMTAHDNWYGKVSSLFAPAEGYIYSNVGSIAYWGICCAVFALAVTAIIWIINQAINAFVYNDDDFVARAEAPFSAFRIRSFGNVIKTLVLAALVVVVFYGVINLIWNWTVVDFRFWTFDLRVFDLARLPSMLKYVPFFFIFYLVNAAMSKNYRVSDLPEWATIAINVVFNVIGMTVMIWYCNSYFINVGAMPDSANNLFFIACYPIIPCVAIATILARRIYVRTGNAWLAGLINAVIFTFLACANTSIEGAVAWTYGA